MYSLIQDFTGQDFPIETSDEHPVHDGLPFKLGLYGSFSWWMYNKAVVKVELSGWRSAVGRGESYWSGLDPVILLILRFFTRPVCDD